MASGVATTGSEKKLHVAKLPNQNCGLCIHHCLLHEFLPSLFCHAPLAVGAILCFQHKGSEVKSALAAECWTNCLSPCSGCIGQLGLLH